MNLRRFLTRLLPVAAIAVLSAVSATAQNCAVRNSYRIANSTTVASELIVDTGWVAGAPLTTPGVNGSTGVVNYSHGSCTPIADYGFLSCSGQGQASNSSTNGVFLYLDGGPQARFYDNLTIASSTLPNGAPVLVQFVLTLSGHANVVDTNPNANYDVTMSAGSISLTIANGTGTAVGVMNTTVGASMLMQANLTIAFYLQGLLGASSPTQVGSYDVDLTAHIGAVCLTPGASLQSCSGHNYSPQASVVSVGGGCGANSPTMAATLPVLGQLQNFSITGAPANQLALFAYSLGNPVSLPLGGCVITENPNGLTLLPVGVTDAAGNSAFSLSIPNSVGLTGVAFTAQSLVFSSNGPLLGFAELSNGLFVTVGL